MKLKFTLVAGAILAGVVSSPIWAQPEPSQKNSTWAQPGSSQNNPTGAQSDPSHKNFGSTSDFDKYVDIKVKNFQDESLGRIQDLGIDLVNGRIVEVLIVTDQSLEGRKKTVAVPPLALYPDLLNEVYRINVSAEFFNAAPAIIIRHWDESGHSNRVAAAYRLFGQEPYFQEEGDAASMTTQRSKDGDVAGLGTARPKVSLGYVERARHILDMPVKNLQNEKFGAVWGMSMDITQGRIRNVIVLAPGNFKTKSIIPATALSFNATRDGLLLDETKAEYADEPRYVYTEKAFGQEDSTQREPVKGPRTSAALEQGSSYRDVDRTVAINKAIRAARINGRDVEVATINDRVTLRGWVNTAEDKRRIEEIAVASRVPAIPEMVDNQIVVGKPVTTN